MADPRLCYVNAEGNVALVWPMADGRLVISGTYADGTPVKGLPCELGRLKAVLRMGADVTLEPEDAWLTRVAEYEARERLPPGDGESAAAHAGRIKDAVAGVVRTTYQELIPLRRWQTCWALQGGKVSVDLAKARACRIQELQEARRVALEALRSQIDEAEDRDDKDKSKALKARRKGLNTLDLVSWAQAARDLAELAREPEEITRVGRE